MGAEKGGQGAWEWLHPQPLPEREPAPQTPSISCLWLWPPAINRCSDSIFFKNKHQTVTTGPEKRSLAGAVPQSAPAIVSSLTPPPAAGTGGPGGQRRTERSLEVRQVGGRAGASSQVQPLPAGSARECGTPPALLGPSLLSCHLPSPVLSL